MKTLFTFIIGALILFTGCKKDDSMRDGATSTKGSWKLGATTYNIKFSYKSTTSGGETLYSFYDNQLTQTNFATLNSVNLSFRNVPTASGTYQLVGIGTTTTGNMFQVSAGGPAGSYAYIGTATDVTVTVSGGKIQVTIPEISMKSTGQGADVTLSGSVQEL